MGCIFTVWYLKCVMVLTSCNSTVNWTTSLSNIEWIGNSCLKRKISTGRCSSLSLYSFLLSPSHWFCRPECILLTGPLSSPTCACMPLSAICLFEHVCVTLPLSTLCSSLCLRPTHYHFFISYTAGSDIFYFYSRLLSVVVDCCWHFLRPVIT